MNPYNVVEDFEVAIAEFTGATYAVTVTSCTMALLLACKYYLKRDIFTTYGRKIRVPRRTYVGVPMSVVNAGGTPQFHDIPWLGHYPLSPLPVIDSARFLTKNMYQREDMQGTLVCLSFHATKILGDTQGGAILTDDPGIADWLRRMRFDGRTPGVPVQQDNITEIGYHCYMSPDVAARLLLHMSKLPAGFNPPLPNDDYPDLSKYEVFK